MIRDSVSVILKNEDKYFFITRQNSLRSFPGYTAFPGGKMEIGETPIEAAQRELVEELSFDIFEDKTVSSYELIGEATSPDFNPKRFRNFYVLVELEKEISFKLCEHEIKNAFWTTEKDFLEKFDRGCLLCVKPMFTILKYLENNNKKTYQDFRLISENDQLKVPVIQMISDLYQIMPLSNTIPPATRTNCFHFDELIIDPSPKDFDEYSKLKETLQKFNFSKILISHHHGDHHQFANQLALDLGLPITISQDSYRRILVRDPAYFDDIVVDFFEDQKIIGHWKNKAVRSYAIPGHDEGHFGFAPDCMNWFIVGDLFQGVGTVVVGGAEGDMEKYLSSLKRVIELRPNCVIPSHGIPLGGVDILIKTYEHRILREKQILDLKNEGKSNLEILKTIYFDLPEKLHKYALANIESHLRRLHDLGYLDKN